METVLVVGFGPFPGAPRNPSAELVRALGKRRRPALADTHVVTAVLPTNYTAVRNELPVLLKRHDPDAVLFFGLASRTRFLRVERRAVNAVTGFYPDAIGAKLATRTFMPGMPAELPVRADVIRLAVAARSAGIDARLSRDAGRYICNAALYQTLHAAREGNRPRLVAFVHIPRPRRRVRLDGKPGRPRPALQNLVRAGEAILVALMAETRRG
jgi:pyroglutamyl-peptidase